MHGKLTLCFILLVAVLSYRPVSSQEMLADTTNVEKEPDDRQIKVNKEALLTGASQQTRIDAATLLLFSDKQAAREILIDALNRPENTAARSAVCHALKNSRNDENTIANVEDFIAPLIKMLRTAEPAQAKLAADAAIILEYDKISKPLIAIINDADQPPQARINAVNALKLQPDKRAVLKLLDLLEAGDKNIADAAESALNLLGIPVPQDASQRSQIRGEIQRKGKAEFLRDFKIRQSRERQIRQLQEQLNEWQKRYLLALDTIYRIRSGDDKTRGEFLIEHLRSPEKTVKLWAIDKVTAWRTGSNPQLPPDMAPILVGLISDADPDVRFKTAGLLSLTGELSSAEKLLAQIKKETDERVRLELFVALGTACSYALLPTSQVEISEQLREETLVLAGEYLLEETPQEARRGAEVTGKLLSQRGLASEKVNKYLKLLLERYQAEKGKSNGSLRGELLNTLAALCSQSVYKAVSARMYQPVFEEALTDPSEGVRQAAADGLINIDSSKALAAFRTESLYNDTDVRIRTRVVELAGKVGARQDLDWLAEKLSAGPTSDAAWSAMLKIFGRCEMQTVREWVDRLEAKHSGAAVSDEQLITFLEIVEQKFGGVERHEFANTVREKLASLYKQIGEYELSAQYWAALLEGSNADGGRDEILSELLDCYLSGTDLAAVRQLIANRLLQKDLGPDDLLVSRLDEFIKNPQSGQDPNMVVAELSRIDMSNTGERPKWGRRIEEWEEFVGTAADSNEPADVNTAVGG